MPFYGFRNHDFGNFSLTKILETKGERQNMNSEIMVSSKSLFVCIQIMVSSWLKRNNSFLHCVAKLGLTHTNKQSCWNGTVDQIRLVCLLCFKVDRNLLHSSYDRNFADTGEKCRCNLIRGIKKMVVDVHSLQRKEFATYKNGWKTDSNIWYRC